MQENFTILPDWLAPSGHFTFVADSRRVNGSPLAIRPRKQYRTARIHPARRTPQPCVGGHSAG